MAEKASKVNILIVGDASKARKALSELDQSAGKTESAFGKLGKFMGGAGKLALMGAGGAAAGLVGGLALATKAAAEDAIEQERLAKVLKNTVKATDEQVAATESWITKQQFATGISDSKLRPALQNLVVATKDVGKAQDLTTVAMDIAAARGLDVETVTLAMAKAYNGNVGALGRLGIQVKDASGETLEFDQVMANAAETFGGSAATAADTAAGRMQIIRERVGELVESVGEKLLPIFEKMLAYLTDHMPEIEAAVSKAFSVIEGAVRFAQKAWEAIAPVLKDMWAAAQPIITQVKDYFVQKFGEIKGWIDQYMPEIKQTITVILKAIQDFWNKWGDEILAYLKNIFEIIKTVVETAVRIVGDIIRLVMAIIQGDWGEAWNAIKDLVGDVWEGVKGIVKNAVEALLIPLGILYDFVKDKLTTVWEGFKGAASKAWGALGGIVNGALRAIAGPISSFLKVIAKIAGAIGMDNLASTLSSAASSVSGWGQGASGGGGKQLEFNRGGPVPGSGPDKDSVLAYLTPEEYVINRKSARKIGRAALDRLNQLGDIGLNRGGVVPRYAKSPDEVLEEGRKRSGPYLWGGFGPRFDCSGFQAWLSNFAATGSGAMGGRWATAQATGYPQRLGRFVKGKGDPATGYSIGVRPSGYGGPIGHTAGTVAGTNVESSGAGSRVGGSARGWDYGPYKYHLPGFGGPSKEMLGWFKEIKDAIAALSSTLATPLAEMMRSLGLSVVKGGAKHMLSKVPLGGTISKVVGLETYDGGGVLRPGYTMAHNATGKPELVLTAEQAKLLGKGPREYNINVNTNDGLQIGRAVRSALVGI